MNEFYKSILNHHQKIIANRHMLCEKDVLNRKKTKNSKFCIFYQ